MIESVDLLTHHFTTFNEQINQIKNNRKGGKPTMKKLTSEQKQVIEKLKTNAIVFLITAVAFTLVGMYISSKIDKNVEVKASQIVSQQAAVSKEQSKQ